MSETSTQSHDELLQHLQLLTERAVKRYALPEGVNVCLINVSENATYRIDDSATGAKWAMRVHRDGYHSRTAIASELAWVTALKASSAAVTPNPIPGLDGDVIQTVAIDGLPQPPQHSFVFLGRGQRARRERRCWI